MPYAGLEEELFDIEVEIYESREDLFIYWEIDVPLNERTEDGKDDSGLGRRQLPRL